MRLTTGLRTRHVRSLDVASDFVALLVFMSELMVLFYTVLGIHDVVSLVALTIGCASQAAERMVSARRAERSADAATGKKIALALAGTAPWWILAAAQAANPAAAIWQPGAVAPAIRLAGIALALAVVVARPFTRSAVRGADDDGTLPILRPDSLLLIGGMLLISSSPLIVAVPVYWLALTIVLDGAWPAAGPFAWRASADSATFPIAS
jgi:hypothetical protein